MSNCYFPQLQILAGTAALRSDVGHRLLNGQRQQVVAEFDLDKHEVEVVMAVEAETLRDFARDLHERITQPGSAQPSSAKR
jgi:hypothetical protein